jgi:N-acetylmuramoyl-L-alanine amidase
MDMVKATWCRIAVLIFSFCAGKAGQAEDWTTIHHNGRSYVTFANVAQFYGFPEYRRVSGSVYLQNAHRSIQAARGADEFSINGVRFLANFPVLALGEDDLVSTVDLNKIIEPVLRPSRIPKREPIETVVLDPGHGGDDSGAPGASGPEKEFTLDAALAARKALILAGYKVEMTRESDIPVSLENRVSFANKFPRAIFISIHFNWSPGGVGLESYALAPEGVQSNASIEHHATFTGTARQAGNALDAQNVALTAAIHASILSKLVLFDRGVRHARFQVLRNVTIPAVLVEGGFLSDPSEGERISTEQFQTQLGCAISQGIQAYNTAINYKPIKKVGTSNADSTATNAEQPPVNKVTGAFDSVLRSSASINNHE